MSEVAFIFPGQGSQQVGMLKDLALNHSVIRDVFTRASEQLSFDLWQLIQNGPQDQLNLTEFAQPAILTASYAIWQVLSDQLEVDVVCMTGHSLGEWSAMVCAGGIPFEQAVRLVQLRGRFMQEAVPAGNGTMAAIIGLDDDQVKAICEEASQGEVVEAVNFNAPGQVVVAGHVKAVERATDLCKAAGAKMAVPLAVSAPFHTSLMRPAADKLAAHLQEVEIALPGIPVIQNVDAQISTDAASVRARLIEQIYAPVQWVDCVRRAMAEGATTLVECGPGKVLAGLAKRIDRGLKVHTTEKPENMAALLDFLVKTQNN